MQQIIFILLALGTLGAAIMVVTSQNLMRSALWLILAFFGIAGIFIMLDAEFLAVTQILIYVGAIAMLIIFAVMLTRGLMDPSSRASTHSGARWAASQRSYLWSWRPLSRAITWPVAVGVVPLEAIRRLGQDFVGAYVIPFEVASVLLVVAMIGAIIVARERE